MEKPITKGQVGIKGFLLKEKCQFRDVYFHVFPARNVWHSLFLLTASLALWVACGLPQKVRYTVGWIPLWFQ